MLPLIFIAISIMTLIAAMGVVTARNLFHAALFLILCFFGVAGLFVTLEAEFLAAAQVLVYIGAISVLIIFAIMLSRGMMIGRAPMENEQWLLSAVVSVLLFGALVFILFQVNWPVVEEAISATAIADIGVALVTTSVVPFLVVAVLLSVALIGAIMIARER